MDLRANDGTTPTGSTVGAVTRDREVTGHPRAVEDSGPPVLEPSAVAPAARQARDPRLRGIVLSRMFDEQVEPQRIGRFTLLDRLGEGGMGVVYAAYDDRLDRKVAVKVLRSWLAGDDSQGHSRLLQEARAMARLCHPNIVAVHEVGTHEGDVFVAMEYVRGQSLDAWLEGGGATGRPWREVVRVFAAAGRGLAAAHRAGIVHRDFKPHNAIVDDEGQVKVLDFGLARVLERAVAEEPAPPAHASSSSSPALTQTGAIMGTPAYMPPEQRAGEPADARSDQFSFFASLYHALYRQLPFPTESAEALRRASAKGRVRPPPSDSPVPRWLHRALLVGLDPDRTRRYPSMEDALVALARDPVARRRRWLTRGASVVVIAGLGAAAVVGLQSPSVAACDRGASTMAQTWGPQVRARVQQGLQASGLPYAEETWQRLESRLDAYGRAWAEARDQACATHRDGQHSVRLYDEQVACLDRGRLALGALVDLLAGADRPTAERALNAAAALPSVARCQDAPALLAAVAPPEDPTVAREVEQQRHRLSRVQSLEALGRYDTGRREAQQVAEVAQRLGYRPLRAEAAVRLGSLTMEYGAPDEADRLLTEALTEALASDHVEAAAEAVARRLFVRAERMRTPERAADDVAMGAGLVDRVEVTPRLRGLYLNNVGAYHIRREDHDAARRVLTQALAVQEARLEHDDPAIAFTLGNLSIVEQRAGHDDRARAYLDQALDSTTRVLGPHHPMTAELARLRGELLMRTGHLRASQQALESVLEILQQTMGPRSPTRHGPLVMLGEIALAQRDHGRARARFEQAAALELPEDGGGAMYQVLEDAGLARALMGLGQHERGIELFARAVRSASLDHAPYETTLRELFARTLLQYDRPETAVVHLTQALAQLDPGSPSLARASSLSARGRALRQSGDLAGAQRDLDQAHAALAALPGTHLEERATLHIERARLAGARGNRSEAIAQARAACVTLASWGEPDHPLRAQASAVLVRALRSGITSPAERREANDLAEHVRAALAGPGFAAERHELNIPLIKPDPIRN